jgi:hypothetical protein
VGGLMDSYEENEQTVTIYDGHVFINKEEGTLHSAKRLAILH